jgi:hypothetical protein
VGQAAGHRAPLDEALRLEASPRPEAEEVNWSRLAERLADAVLVLAGAIIAASLIGYAFAPALILAGIVAGLYLAGLALLATRGAASCKEGEGLLVYWCVRHSSPWRPDLEPVCDEARRR